MASRSSSSGPGGIPWAVVLPVAHAVFDVATSASCPNCNSQVVLYFCTGCKRPV